MSDFDEYLDEEDYDPCDDPSTFEDTISCYCEYEFGFPNWVDEYCQFMCPLRETCFEMAKELEKEERKGVVRRICQAIEKIKSVFCFTLARL